MQVCGESGVIYAAFNLTLTCKFCWKQLCVGTNTSTCQQVEKKKKNTEQFSYHIAFLCYFEKRRGSELCDNIKDKHF